MARIRTVLSTLTEVALVAATPKTVLQAIAPTNQRIAVRGFSISFDGIDGAAEPVLVEMLRQTTAGTVTAATPLREDPGSETVQGTGGKNATVEPSAGDVLRVYNVHPQSGIEIRWAPDEELVIGGGGRMGIRATAQAAVNCLPQFFLEE